MEMYWFYRVESSSWTKVVSEQIDSADIAIPLLHVDIFVATQPAQFSAYA